MVETELRHLRLNIYQDDFMRHWDFLHRDHFLRCGSRGCRSWWCSSRWCSGISSVVGILIFLFILSHAV
jgi:hypothetical protein